MKSGRLLKWGAPIGVGLLGILLWHVLVDALDVPHYIVPSPARVIDTLITDWHLLFNSLLITLKITFGAFFMAVLLGTTVAFLFVQSRWIEVSFFPYAVLLQVTPIVAIAPLIIIWVKSPTAALVTCATIVALFPIISNTTLGLRSVNPRWWISSDEQGRRWQTLTSCAFLQPPPYSWRVRISSGCADRRRGRRVRRRHRRHLGRARLPDLQAGFSITSRAYSRRCPITLTGVMLFC